jgi:hypothetical protein
MITGGPALLRTDVHHEGAAIVLQVTCLFVCAEPAHTCQVINDDAGDGRSVPELRQRQRYQLQPDPRLSPLARSCMA